MKYDLIKDNKLIKTKDFQDQPPTLSSNKGKWLERVNLEAPEYCQYTQELNLEHQVTETQSIHEYVVYDLPPEDVEANINNLKTTKINETDRQTAQAIEETLSTPMQRNYLAKYNELLEQKLDGTITAEGLTLMDSMKEVWTTIENLRMAGNEKEALITACTTIEELEGI